MDWLTQTTQNLQYSLHYLFSPDNPFVPWLVIIDLVALLIHLALVYWVYRDALARYNRGAPWAVLTAVFPLGGWLFYLLYRKSPLVEFDRIDAELFDEADYEWTDYDTYRANQSARLFTELSALWRKPEAAGYSPWVRMSRLRELRCSLTPEEKQARREQRRSALAHRKQQRLERRKQKALRRREVKQVRRERTTMTAAHGFRFRMSERQQRGWHRKLEVVEKLKTVAREDQLLEEMIYEMDYQGALAAARDSLAIAEEMNDPQAIITYHAYIARLEGLLKQEAEEEVD